MLNISVLEDHMGEGDWVVVRPDGEVVEMSIPKNIGPATLIVSVVTDALKTQDGIRLTGSLDRDAVWAVDAFALNRVVVRRLEGEYSPLELYQAVLDMSLGWQVDQAPVD